jgi:uncharacterized protein (DUF427 family)
MTDRLPESVWDYPRPPRVEADDRRVEIVFDGRTVVSSARALRVLETSHPPAFYVPRADCDPAILVDNDRQSFCEYKGLASYVDIVVGDRSAEAAGWFYPRPSPGYEALRDHIAFYPGRMDRCVVGGHEVAAQPGDFYGGWITPEITGPFKGAPGTQGW